MSVLRHDAEGREIVLWEVVSGALTAYEGRSIRTHSSPCGLCLSVGTTILVSRPERAYGGLRDTQPPISEALAVPLHDGDRKPLGTLWIAHHDHTSHCSSEDARILEQLAVQAVLAVKLLECSREGQCAGNLLDSYHRAQHKLLAHDLLRERSLRKEAEESERKMRRALALRDSAIQEAHHRVKNTLQIAGGLLFSQARATDSEQVRSTLQESHRRLQLLAKVHEQLCSGVGSAQSIFVPTLLDTLSNALRQSFVEISTRVKIEIMAEPLALPAEEAIAVALFINEVVTNAYKHAFPNESRGEITVTLNLTHDNLLILRVTDDGIGLHTKSIVEGVGLKLIRAFAAQLRGVLTILAEADSPGTVISLTMCPPLGLRRGFNDSSLDSAASKPS